VDLGTLESGRGRFVPLGLGESHCVKGNYPLGDRLGTRKRLKKNTQSPEKTIALEIM